MPLKSQLGDRPMGDANVPPPLPVRDDGIGGSAMADRIEDVSEKTSVDVGLWVSQCGGLLVRARPGPDLAKL